MGSASSRTPMLKRPRMKTLDEKENGESYEVFTTDVKEISKVGGKNKAWQRKRKVSVTSNPWSRFLPRTYRGKGRL